MQAGRLLHGSRRVARWRRPGAPRCVGGAGGPFLLGDGVWRMACHQHTHSHGAGGHPPPAELVHSARVMGHGGPELEGEGGCFLPLRQFCQSGFGLGQVHAILW